MYPQRELNRLAAYKAALRYDIALRRAQCASAAAGALQPLAWIDRALALSRRISPLTLLAALPLGGWALGAALPRSRLVTAVVRWGPLVFGAVRGLRLLGAARRPSVAGANGRH